MISEEFWSKLAPLLPGKVGDRGRSGADNRQFIEAVLFVGRTGCPWRDLPSSFGPWNSVYQRFARWESNGVWEAIFAAFSQDADFTDAHLDSTTVKAHQHAAGAQKKTAIKLLVALAEASPPNSTL